jgi:hypothetical protein
MDDLESKLRTLGVKRWRRAVERMEVASVSGEV